MSAKRSTLGIVALAGAGALAAASQPWVNFEIDGGGLESSTGYTLNAALSPVAIAVVIAALALTIAGPIFRRVLGVLVAGLGAGIAALAAGVAVDPESAIAARVAEITGLTGHGGIAAVSSFSVTVWPWVTVAAGVVVAVAGLVVLLLSGKWAVAGRKYEAAAKDGSERPRDRISDWDALSDGDDPTDGAETEPGDDPTPPKPGE